MPIRNVGTLLENLVVTETAGHLLGNLGGKRLFFASAFAMPPLSRWVTHGQCAGFSAEDLAAAHRCLNKSFHMEIFDKVYQREHRRGPNAVLLVGLAATELGAPLTVWANDIPDGCYGDAIPALWDAKEVISELSGSPPRGFEITVSSDDFPESLGHLEAELNRSRNRAEAVLGFLDPMRYRTEEIGGPYTGPSGHGRWLSVLARHPQAVTVHFTGNCDTRSRGKELESMRGDLEGAGFKFWVEFRRQHYVVSVAARRKSTVLALECRIIESWKRWCGGVRRIRVPTLRVTNTWRAERLC